MNKTILAAIAFSSAVSVANAQSDSAQFYLQKGIEQKTSGRLAEAHRHFEKAYAFAKDDRQVVGELAASLLHLRRYVPAREMFAQLEKLGDRSDSTYRQLMLLSFNTRKWDDAIRYAQLLEKAAPAEKTAYYLGKSYYEKEDLGNAIRHFEVAMQEDPQHGEIPYTVARAYADMQNYRQSIAYFQKAVAISPQKNRWIYEMALMYFAVNDDKNALKYMIEAGEKGYKRDMEYLQNLSVAYINAGRFQEGIAILQDILQKRPSDVAVIASLADAYYNAKKYDDAIAYYDELLRLNNKHAEALYMIGMSYQQKGEKAKGAQLCDKAIEMDPSMQSLKQEKKLPVF